MRGKLQAGYKLETGQLDKLGYKLESWTTGQLEPMPHELENSRPGGRAGKLEIKL